MGILYCIKVISDTRGLILRTKGLKAVELNLLYSITSCNMVR